MSAQGSRKISERELFIVTHQPQAYLCYLTILTAVIHRISYRFKVSKEFQVFCVHFVFIQYLFCPSIKISEIECTVFGAL
jgi:hypothetical protein